MAYLARAKDLEQMEAEGLGLGHCSSHSLHKNLARSDLWVVSHLKRTASAALSWNLYVHKSPRLPHPAFRSGGNVLEAPVDEPGRI